MRLSRPLDTFEIQLSAMPVAKAVEYDGEVDESLFERAFEILTRRHPVLLATVDNANHWLHVATAARPRVIRVDGGLSSMWDEFDRDWNIHQAVSRLVLVRSDGGGFVMLVVDHSIADARSSDALFAELWDIVADLAANRAVGLDARAGLPPSPSQLLHERWSGDVVPPSPAAASQIPGVVVSAAWYRTVSLDVVQTARLLKHARHRGASVHSLLCGVILVGLRRESERMAPDPMACWSAVDLRGRVSPPVSPTESTILSFRHRAHVDVAPDSDPAAIGLQIKDQITRDLDRRHLSTDLSELFTSSVETRLDQHLAQMMLTNPGVKRELRHPESVRIRRHLRPVVEATTVPFPVHGAYTYQGCLNLWCIYPADRFSEEQADRLADFIQEALGGAKGARRRTA